MKRKSFLLLLFSVILFLASCSGSDISESNDKYNDSITQQAELRTEEVESSNEFAFDRKSDITSNVTIENTQKNESVTPAERMFIHKVNLEVRPKSLSGNPMYEDRITVPDIEKGELNKQSRTGRQ